MKNDADRVRARSGRAGAVAVAGLLVAGLLAGCSSDGSEGSGGSRGAEGSGSSVVSTEPVGEATTDAEFRVDAGIGFVAVEDAEPGALLVLGTDEDDEVARALTDRFGSLIFRDLEQGQEFTVRTPVGDEVAGSDPVTTLAEGEHPEQAFYDGLPAMTDGHQYLETRDGTTLSLTVRFPEGKSAAEGPFPTLINMSGYADADPETAPPMSLIGGILGFATVSVNVRGTGCSGGVNGLFDEIWAADGYDVVEAVAAQDWASKVGLAGISFPGITQLGTASTNPPHLAATAPMSVLADIYRTPGYPGGIYNNGFTETWLTDRRNDAMPVPERGQGYARKLVEEGDEECAANQRLRLQTLDVIELAAQNPYRDPKLIDGRSPINVIADIEAPMLVMGAWQDEQVGADFANLFGFLPEGDDVKAVVANGVHSAPIELDQLTQWLAFMQIYVAEKVPDYSILASVAGGIAPEAQGGDTETGVMPENPYLADETLEAAKARYEALPRFRVLFDNGGDPERPGVPGASFEHGFDTWPPKEMTSTRWFFGPDGTLSAEEPTGDDDAADRYFPDIDARPMQTIPGQGQSESWVLLPDYDWRPLVADTAVGYATEPLTADTTMVGPGSVDLWLSSTTADTDLQVTLTEVRADGTEIYVQNGWLRASHRFLDEERSTELNPWPTHLKKDGADLPIGEFTPMRVAIVPVGHVFRKGSKVRITVEAPGGDRTRWSFDSAPPPFGAEVLIGRSAEHPSSIVLPLSSDLEAAAVVPACPGLRGQPCRPYEPATNGG